VVLCKVCQVTIVAQPGMFDELRGTRRHVQYCPITNPEITDA
jgi:hypothetical protein